MSWISGQISMLERHRGSRRQARLHARSLWSDAAADRFEDKLFDELEQEDRRFDADLKRLDAAFDEAKKLL
ncbi:hypothetical protein H7J88_01565 [Mycolicibacterium flavescens]|uniref:Uncharacterized protein n=1 Tax=Mycolicibacterium flavescens TaxID=1776 RepID=A0A1E3RB99_MYCFV|nr:hypothetical protein [Mycolicibacterium flavescens]MCV7278332.1 hypothetical protein [Mycolicibacterium flavescens]ODQ87173.1 hypothetical protein BHQ18_24745 [Mycolicibacterium flavescens]